MNKLVSIIMAAYNTEQYIGEAINSVLQQNYQNWELLIINDGSTDNTEAEILKFTDDRIKYFSKSNGGVSVARNTGLTHMKGDYFGFLDSDDLLPANSLSSRVKILDADPSIDFVDGIVHKFYEESKRDVEWNPAFKGNPFEDLIGLRGSSFLGLTWLIRRQVDHVYSFGNQLTHCEDLIFFIGLSRYGGNYTYVAEHIYQYRMRDGSAMSDLRGLENGYLGVINYLRDQLSCRKSVVFKTRIRIIRIMFLSYLIDGKNLTEAIKSIFRLLLK